ncbi:DsbA family protein [Tropicibacter sp. R16_0]|uniref:DsbA family protein n=1 Tax=Tropicibacter sp. R16_0 TaxID=2821102 RepID=UPI001ADD36BF|nr:DsbA family protein [Tropicibacter sp. R16_0]MBO9449641.1 DsbA family protein [Tropicibacter sp. R16_0]
MSFDSLIKSRIAAHLTSEARLNARRRSAERKRERSGQPHVVSYFHDVSNPYSHLTAQVLQRLQDRYAIELKTFLISGPPDWATPAPEQLKSFARSDAAHLARRAGLSFPSQPHSPDTDEVGVAETQICANLGAEAFAETAVSVGEQLWSGTLSGSLINDVSDTKAQGDRELDRLGHYLGATFHYGGEWYWGVDRLHYLEARLMELGLDRDPSARDPFVPPDPIKLLPGTNANLEIEAFLSFRSPYSYLAFERLRELASQSGATLRIRPVLPMVMRGLPVPKAKRMYILMDVSREARRLGVPFGRICDPLGEAVERAYALISYVRNAGRLETFTSSFLRGVWSEGIDGRTDRGLARIVERAGLKWSEAKPLINNTAWKSEVEANRQALTDMGLWGVPSFRVGQTVTWGQDRLWMIAEALRQHQNQTEI